MDIWQTFHHNKETMTAWTVMETLQTELRRLEGEMNAMARERGNATPTAEYKKKWNDLERKVKQIDKTSQMLDNILKGRSPFAK
jgi:predicted nuclease with TOPRIM domain